MVFKQLILMVSTLGGCAGLERTVFNSFYFGSVWWSLNNLFLTVSALRGCGGHERTDFYSFYFGRVWWS